MAETVPRAERGRYARGNPGGPGRPRRPIEADYLRTLTDACPPDTWRQICDKAVEDAQAGDGKAREWLSRYLLGKEPSPNKIAEPPLTELAAAELAGYDSVADRARDLRSLQDFTPAALLEDLRSQQ